MSSTTPSSSTHRWKFFRAGGLDQVSLETGADLLNLEHLDQKLWVALSCPVKGLELDEKTLALIDTDGDGRIRVPELLASIKWAAVRLKDVGDLLKGIDGLPLAAINDATPEGKVLASSARQILSNLGKRDASAISVAETANTAAIFATNPLNGDGVITPEATDDPAAQALMKDIIACLGGTADRTGSVGVSSDKVDAFFAELTAYVSWVEQSANKETAVLGQASDAAVAALKAIRTKVEDYFARCRLAAFDSRAISALNRQESEYYTIAAKDMKVTADEIAGFPLARIEASRSLPLLEGVNPAWAPALATLHKVVVTPLLGAGKTTLTEAEWNDINAKLAPFETWLGSKPASAVEKLGLGRVKEILAGKGREALADLVARDKALEPEYKAISEVDRLARFYRDFRTLLHNFVNFADFYDPKYIGVFQAGTLYLDARSCDLCIKVDGPSPLAAMSKAYIAYCDCTRPGSPAMKIAACFTQGDSDYLFVGRHGLFYDRHGRDWDAVITSIVDNPISIRQAFWSPYKKFLRMIEEQVAKRAAASEAASSSKLSSAAEQTANADKAKPVDPAKKIDVGAVAALGVAFGALTTAFGYFLGFFKGMPAWEVPLVFVGVALLISLPSMIIAWLKLRQRTLGPILDANGWAVNGRVKINIPLGTALTERASLPPGSKLALNDPFEDKEAAQRKRQLIFLLIVLALIAIGIRWDHSRRGRYFWQPEPAPQQAPAAPSVAANPAPATAESSTPAPAK